ncbi:hypothetical protein IMZ48_35595 [Candidatus Bathyarchaeota archaeon]|nr:hypothetical protein [Candidatus Bathyarchaeota archaeon]
MTSAGQDDLQQLCNAFITDKSVPPEILDALRRFVVTQPRRITPPPLPLADEIDERKQLGKKIQLRAEISRGIQKVPGSSFWALLMTVPIVQLRDFTDKYCQFPIFNAANMVRKELVFLFKACESSHPQAPSPIRHRLTSCNSSVQGSESDGPSPVSVAQHCRDRQGKSSPSLPQWLRNGGRSIAQTTWDNDPSGPAR